MSVLKKLAGETAMYGLSTMVGRMLYYLLVMLHTKLFLPEQLAIQVQLYAYAGLSLVVYTFGMESAYFYFARKENDRQKYYNLVLSAVILVSVFLSGSIFIFADFIAKLIEYPNEAKLIRWMSVIMAIDGIVSIPFARLRLEKKAKQFVTARVANILMNIALNFFFLIICRDIHEARYLGIFKPVVDLFYSPEAAPGFIVLANLIANMMFFLFLYKEFIDFRFVFDMTLFKPLWVYAFPLFVMNLAGVTNLLFDRTFLQYLLPEGFYPNRTTKDAIGIYGQCLKLSIFMNLAIQAFKYAAEPFFYSKAEDKNAPSVFADVMKWFIVICATMWVGICVNLHLLADLFLKKKIFHEGLAVVPWLLMGFLFLGIYYNLATWFKLSNRTQYGTYITLTGASITIVLNILLVPVIGYLGCGIAFSVSGLVMMTLCYYYGQKYYPIPYHLKSGLAYILGGGIFILLDAFLIPSGSLSHMVYHMLFFVLFCIIVIFAERKALPARFQKILSFK
ncbi:oligosaccharide flippase family protein [Dyadobacter frigoris]|uniref:Polysaccharide biosynthesis protein n=1 Tax=Dyadobacter frigoris TaxID=2576211 RepID=A0A4U6D8K7_9BACT|nr:polysaccharide biosynthesis C-terminal domain-containing protein [Dyadobacter frigoris]TKT93809.1 polysaccharide biosynthesis protein [Dyadobacter frigoris]GLU50976.1 polysaccharide biosynthesis protein [Dyadobacter frigoris]